MFKLLRNIIAIILLGIISFIGINGYVIYTGNSHIAAVSDTTDSSVSSKELDELQSLEAEAILVLGAGLNGYGGPSPILQERLDLGIYLYKQGAGKKLLLSGDNGTVTYNEVIVMHNYVVDAGIPEEDIFVDHAGFSTYESVYRAKEVFQVERMIVVTQKYHMYRALYIADKLGVEALGACSNQQSTGNDVDAQLRESFARIKDFAYSLFKPEPTFLGDPFPIEGSGLETH